MDNIDEDFIFVDYLLWTALIKDRYTRTQQLGSLVEYLDNNKVIAFWETGVLSDGRLLSNNQYWKIHVTLAREIAVHKERSVSYGTTLQYLNCALRNEDTPGCCEEKKQNKILKCSDAICTKFLPEVRTLFFKELEKGTKSITGYFQPYTEIYNYDSNLKKFYRV